MNGPVRHLVRAGQVVSKTEMVSKEQARTAMADAAKLTWKEQADEQERLASILLTQLKLRIEAGESDDDVLDQLAKLTTMTKRFMSKDDGIDYDKVSPEQLAAAAAKAK